jgi:hypothetical protein
LVAGQASLLSFTPSDQLHGDIEDKYKFFASHTTDDIFHMQCKAMRVPQRSPNHPELEVPATAADRKGFTVTSNISKYKVGVICFNGSQRNYKNK